MDYLRPIHRNALKATNYAKHVNERSSSHRRILIIENPFCTKKQHSSFLCFHRNTPGKLKGFLVFVVFPIAVWLMPPFKRKPIISKKSSLSRVTGTNRTLWEHVADGMRNEKRGCSIFGKQLADDEVRLFCYTSDQKLTVKVKNWWNRLRVGIWKIELRFSGIEWYSFCSYYTYGRCR